MSRRKGYYKVGVESFEDVELMQDSLERTLQPILTSDIIDGTILKNVFLATGAVNIIAHKLNRPLLGWIIISKSAVADIYQSETNKPNLFLNLNTTADVTVSLWVF